MMNIEQVSKTKIIYKRRTGAYGIENKHLMAHFKAWLNDNEFYQEDSVILAIPQDNPEHTKPQDCRYDVALVVDSFEKFEDFDVKKGTLEAGKYLVFTIEHTPQAVMETMKNMFFELSKKGYILNDQQPIIERYKKHLVDNHQCQICVPIL